MRGQPAGYLMRATASSGPVVQMTIVPCGGGPQGSGEVALRRLIYERHRGQAVREEPPEASAYVPGKLRDRPSTAATRSAASTVRGSWYELTSAQSLASRSSVSMPRYIQGARRISDGHRSGACRTSFTSHWRSMK